MKLKVREGARTLFVMQGGLDVRFQGTLKTIFDAVARHERDHLISNVQSGFVEGDGSWRGR